MDMHEYTHNSRHLRTYNILVLNLPATVNLVVLLLSTANLDVSVTGMPEVTLHRTVLYGPEDLGTPVGDPN